MPRRRLKRLLRPSNETVKQHSLSDDPYEEIRQQLNDLSSDRSHSELESCSCASFASEKAVRSFGNDIKSEVNTAASQLVVTVNDHGGVEVSNDSLETGSQTSRRRRLSSMREKSSSLRGLRWRPARRNLTVSKPIDKENRLSDTVDKTGELSKAEKETVSSNKVNPSLLTRLSSCDSKEESTIEVMTVNTNDDTFFSDDTSIASTQQSTTKKEAAFDEEVTLKQRDMGLCLAFLYELYSPCYFFQVLGEDIQEEATETRQRVEQKCSCMKEQCVPFNDGSTSACYTSQAPIENGVSRKDPDSGVHPEENRDVSNEQERAAEPREGSHSSNFAKEGSEWDSASFASGWTDRTHYSGASFIAGDASPEYSKWDHPKEASDISVATEALTVSTGTASRFSEWSERSHYSGASFARADSTEQSTGGLTAIPGTSSIASGFMKRTDRSECIVENGAHLATVVEEEDYKGVFR